MAALSPQSLSGGRNSRVCVRFAMSLSAGAQEGIRRDAACADHIARVRLMHRLLEARHERMHDRRAERGRKALPVERFALLLGVVGEVDDRGFQAGEGKIERRILDAAVGQLIALRVAVLRERVDLRPPG